MKTCPACAHELPDRSRFCTRCGTLLEESSGPSRTAASSPEAGRRDVEEMNMPALYAMVAGLILALLVPPWEAPPGQPPEFLGFHFVLAPPEGDAGSAAQPGVVSRILLTIELVTIAIAGFFSSWLFRTRSTR